MGLAALGDPVSGCHIEWISTPSCSDRVVHLAADPALIGHPVAAGRRQWKLRSANRRRCVQGWLCRTRGLRIWGQYSDNSAPVGVIVPDRLMKRVGKGPM